MSSELAAPKEAVRLANKVETLQIDLIAALDEQILLQKEIIKLRTDAQTP